MAEHVPVLLHETIGALAVAPGGRYVDATYGRGGHAAAIAEQLGTTGRLLVMDRDPAAVAHAHERFGDDPRVMVRHSELADLGAAVAQAGWSGTVNGLLLDIGVSSPQLDDPRRGFSFQSDGPLDMRMDPDRGIAAAAWLAQAEAGELYRVFRRYGEERFSKRIVRAILAARERGPIDTTRQLADLVAAAVPVREAGRHPATRVFQALRIQVNDELGQLEAALAQTVAVLAPGGRLAVISFHSLEDRLVKRFMRSGARPDPMWRGLPDIPAHAQPAFARPPAAVRASAAEIERNPRSRSAILRVAERQS